MGTPFPTPMVEELAKAARKRFYTMKLEGYTDQAAFAEIIKTMLETYEEFRRTP